MRVSITMMLSATIFPHCGPIQCQSTVSFNEVPQRGSKIWNSEKLMIPLNHESVKMSTMCTGHEGWTFGVKEQNVQIRE
jgi:hypothetical protein